MALLLGGAPFLANTGRACAQGDGYETIGPRLVEQLSQIYRHKKARTPAQRKIDWNILQVVQQAKERMLAAQHRESPGFADLSAPILRIDDEGRIEVKLTVAAVTDEQVEQLEALGMDIGLTLPKYGVIEGTLSYDQVEAVAGLDSVMNVAMPGYALHNTGDVTSEGDAVLQAAEARQAFGVDGSGVKIGVMSNGVDHLSESVASGDLPSSVQVLQNDGGDEGTAMLEVVHDLAPGSPLAFYGPGSSSDMVAGIGALKNAGCNIIVDDIGYYDEPKFEDGPIAQEARQFCADGGVYVTSAGNGAQEHYIHQYVRTTWPGSGYEYAHDYGGGDVGNTFAVPSGGTITTILQWNNQWGLSGDDFDLVLHRSSDMEILEICDDYQEGDGNPREMLSWTNSTASSVSVCIAVWEWSLVSPPSSLMLDYHVWYLPSPLQYSMSENSVIGHQAVEEVLSTAAADAATANTIEDSSSRGPGTVYFPTYEERQVPNIAGVDGVQTKTGQLGHFGNPFYGTSASAPHVAAIAALVWQANPTLTSGQVFDAITSTAVDLGSFGWDATWGFGRVDAYDAVNTAGVPGQPDITVSPTAFDETLPPNTTQDYTLNIGNTGDATLTYNISDRDATGPTAPAGVEPPTVPGRQPGHRHGLIQLNPSQPLSFPTPPTTGTEIYYDDGVADTARGWAGAGGEFAVRFTPPSYPVSLETARICLWADWPDSDHEQFAMKVYDDDGADGEPGTCLGTQTTTATNWDWWDVDISGLGIVITGGDFYIAYEQLTDSGFDYEAVCVDEDAPDGRSWLYWGGDWSLCDYGDYMIRCVVEEAVEDCLWLSENPSSGSVAPGDPADSIAVTIDTTGLTEGEYSAQIVIASNDPDENPKIVPVALHVVPGANNPPNAPSNPSPANHATGVSVNADLSWTGGDPDADDTLTYDVYFGTSATPPLVSYDQSATSYDPGTLDNTKYYWNIVAADNHGAFAEGPVWDFTTAGVPGQPDITVSPTAFDETLPPDTIQDYTLNIGNVGDATLTYTISDRDTTGPTAPAGVEPPTVPARQLGHRHGLIQLNPSEPLSFPTPPTTGTEIYYDDGVADTARGWAGAGGEFAVRFTPPSYPVSLKTARICLWADWPDSDHEQFAMKVYDDDGPDGEPGTCLGTQTTTATNWDWWDVDISGLGIVITGGDFYIAYEQLTDSGFDCEAVCVDEDAPDGRSWLYWGGDWSLCDYGDYMIRCVVEEAVEDCLWLSENPSSGSVAPGDPADSIAVTIDTTGLTEGEYSAQIVIASNDPDENPKIVPVSLTVAPPGDEDNPDVAAGLATISGKLVLMYGYKAGEGVGGWTVYNPQWAVTHPEWNSLTTLYVQRGYWIDASQACDLTYEANTYELDEGWNLIGWCGATAVSPPAPEDNPDAATGLDFIEDQLAMAYGYKAGEGVGGWTVYNPEWAAAHPEWNSLTTLYVQRGYWIDVEQACSLEYGSQLYGLDAGWNLIGWLGW